VPVVVIAMASSPHPVLGRGDGASPSAGAVRLAITHPKSMGGRRPAALGPICRRARPSCRAQELTPRMSTPPRGSGPAWEEAHTHLPPPRRFCCDGYGMVNMSRLGPAPSRRRSYSTRQPRPAPLSSMPLPRVSSADAAARPYARWPMGSPRGTWLAGVRPAAAHAEGITLALDGRVSDSARKRFCLQPAWLVAARIRTRFGPPSNVLHNRRRVSRGSDISHQTASPHQRGRAGFGRAFFSHKNTSRWRDSVQQDISQAQPASSSPSGTFHPIFQALDILSLDGDGGGADRIAPLQNRRRKKPAALRLSRSRISWEYVPLCTSV